MRRLFSYIAFVLLFGAASAALAQQVPEAGTSIDNQASGFHLYPNMDDSAYVESNVVSAIIQESENISMFPDHRVKTRRGQRQSFQHQLTNTGNVATTVTISVANTTDDDYDLEDIVISGIETSSNGMVGYEIEASSIEDELTISVQPGEVFTFEVDHLIPNDAEPGDFGKVTVQAKTASGKLVLNNTNIIEVLEGPVIEVLKESAEADSKQGGTITYLITGSNDGDQAARTLNINVDGNPMQKVLLRDQIPANTHYLRTDDTQGGLALYHNVNDPEFEYTTEPPEDLTLVDEFAVAYDSLAPGQSFDARFTVTVNENASGRIINVAQVDYSDPVDGEGGQSKTAETNEVQEVLPEYDAELDYYTDDSYDTISRGTRMGNVLRLQANAAACNVSSALRDTTQITLVSQKTDDEETFSAIETGPNSGYFRIDPNVPTADASTVPVTKNNGTFETLGDDIITATLGQCVDNQEAITATIYVSPYGTVFDSKTGDPISGAEVTLIDVTGENNGGNPGAPAKVYNEEGSSEVESTQLTGGDGQFAFPFVNPGTYRIEVKLPAGYRFPSVVPESELPAGKTIDQAASYGEEFTVEEDSAGIGFDIPVDIDDQGILFIEKSSSIASAEVGDFVTYQLKVTNNSSSSVQQVRVEDMLPFGFRYEQGSTQIDGEVADDPEGGKGPALTFNVGDIEGSSSVTITYRVMLGAGAMNGDGVNTATAFSGQGLQLASNEARAAVEVRAGVFTDKGFIAGKVFADLNENDVQDPGEPGVPGVRIYLENGSFVITDSEGMYTFYGIIPNKHVLKVDNYTLPAGSRLGVLDNRHAGDPSTRFVDLKKGELHRADFAICDLTPAAKEEVMLRREAYAERVSDEVGKSVDRKFNTNDNNQVSGVKRAQASGTVDNTELPDFNKKKIQPKGPAAPAPGDSVAADTSEVTSPAGITLEEAMVYEKAEAGFMNLADNDTLKANQTNVWIKSPLGATMALKVNGEEIGQEKISKKSELKQTNLQAYEYIGLKLQPGKNVLTLSITDPFGNERAGKEINVYAPGKIEQIKLTVPVNDVPADGNSAAVVRAELQDKSGLPVKSKIPVTLDVSIGEWLVKDNDPATPGTQTTIENGTAEFELQSTIDPQDADVRVSIGTLEAETTVSFLPDLRPLIAAGIIEGTLRLNDGASIVPAHSADGFERELRSLSYSKDNATADARAAFFLKGKIKGNMLLTAGFDSEKDDDRLFRDIQPDEFYPVYGESSVKGYDAQSTGRLYVRVDHKKTYALYGDFLTQDRHEAKSLGEYNRTQTGIKMHYEKDWARVNVFGSQASSLRRIDEFRGQGLSGPYELEFDNILINSEQIEIITRDRNQPSVILEREQLTRFRDYTIEPFTGKIIFKSPVPSLDSDLNPVFIRVTYEVEDGAADYLIGGADGQFKITDFFEVGGSFVEDRNPEDQYRLKSVNSTLRLGDNTLLIGEAAESTTESEGTGRGGRVELQHRGNAVDARIFAGQTDEDFVNRASQLGQGRTEAGARTSVKLGSGTRLEGDFLYSSNDTMNTSTTGGLISLRQKIGDRISAEAGFRYSKQDQAQGTPGASEDITNKNIRGKLTVGVPKVEGASVFGEYEQDINDSERKLIAVGGEYEMRERGRIYARHEFISSALGAYRLNSSTERQNTVVGIDANYMQDGQVYSEYRVDNAFDGRNAQAAIGLRNRFEIYEGFGINAGLERVFSLTGEPQNEGTAISTSVDYTANPLWKATARAEARFGTNANSYLSTLGYGRKINPNWTFLGKNIFSMQTSSDEDTQARIQQRLRFGFAYRETAQNRFDALGRYELKYEQNGQFGDDYNRLVHIFSTNVNYHPSADWTHSARFAAKKVAESSADFDSESLTMLLSGRSIHDITRKLDGGINASIMSDAGFNSKDFGVGAEVGYVVKRNLRLAVGFNVFGFEDRDLTASNYTRKGVYVGFSYKFDERLFRGLVPDEDQAADLYATCTECVEQPVAMSVEMLKMPEQQIEFAGIQPVIIEAPEFRITENKSLTTLPRDIHFATNESALSGSSREMLDLISEFLKGQSEFKLEIKGHTDSRASNAYNLKLSERRAKSVQRYLVSKGVDARMVDFKGMSEDISKTSGEVDVVDRAVNRRVELSLDIPNVNVRFIPQINDLQVEKNINKSLPEWDYIFNAKINAVPDRIHVTENSLNAVTKYLLDRVAMTLHHYPEETATVYFISSQQNAAGLVEAYMQQNGADMNRVEIQEISGATNGHGKQGMMSIEYKNESKLQTVFQKDDYMLAESAAIQLVLEKMLELLKLREDHLLISKTD